MENPNTQTPTEPQDWVVTTGEALIDLITEGDGRLLPCLGGAVYNLTRALALQDVPTAYLNPLSGDAFGQRLCQGLIDAGVALTCPEPVLEPTSLAVVQVGVDGHPRYAFYRQGVADRAIDAAGLIGRTNALGTVSFVCTGALALDARDAPAYLPWLDAQRTSGRLVVIDANWRPSVMPDLERYRAHVRQALNRADVIKVSDEDLAGLLPEVADVLEAARALLHASGARVLALTRGAQGAILLTRAGSAWRAELTHPVPVVDTVGAGDCFLAALVARWRLLGLAPDWGLQAADDAQGAEILAAAVASATVCVTRAGCQPPTAAEVRAMLQAVRVARC